MSHINQFPRKLFRIESSTNGVDSTFEVICNHTNCSIASFSYWEAKNEALADAKLFQTAMERFYHYGEFDLAGLLTSNFCLKC